MAVPIRVLYVDDESVLLDLCKTYLERSNDVIVTTASGAPDAIRVLERERFDAIVSDYQMPEMNGIEFLTIVRARGDKTPFIIFTGKGREEVVIAALNAGADFYIQKGGEPKAQFAELAHKIKKAVEGKQAQRALVESERKYRHVIEHSGEAVAVVQDGMLRLVNRRAVEFTGYSEQELLSMPFSLVIHPDDRAMVVERHQKRLRGEPFSSRYAFRLSPKDGSARWVEISAVRIDWEGRPATLNFLTDITERRQAEDALRENQARLDLALHSAGMGVWHWDIVHDKRSFDAQTCHLLGIDPATFTGSVEEFLAAVHPDDRKKLKDALTRTVERDALYEPSYRTIWSDGSIHHITARGRLVKDPTGRPQRINGIIWDISDRKKAEDALRESEVRFREQYQNNPLAIFTWQHRNGDFILVDCNKAAQTLTNGRANTFIGKTASMMYAARPEILTEIRQAFSHKTRISKDLVSEHFLPGRLVRTTATCVPSNFIMVHMEDITERTKTENALRESEERYRNVVEDQTEFISRFLPDGTHVFVNDAYCRYFEKTRDEIIGRRFMPNIPQEDHAIVREHFRSLAPEHPVASVIHRIMMPDGTVRWQRWSDRAIFDKTGTIIEYQSVGRDITEIKQTEDALALASKKLSLLSSITRHDIQNLVLTLRGYLDLSRDFINDPGKLQKFLDNVDKAAATIEEQIAFTKQYQKMGVLAPSWQNVNANVEKAQKQFLLRDVRIEVTCPGLDIFADPLFEKVFYNLIDNALRYGGERMKTIRVSAQEFGTHLSLICEDDGAGITDEDKKRLFTKGFGKHTGLGLFLTREILAITGITIAENGIPGKGARFEIKVPKGMYRLTGAEKR